MNNFKTTIEWSNIKVNTFEEGSDIYEKLDICQQFSNELDCMKTVNRYVSGTYEMNYDGKVVGYTDFVEVAMYWLQNRKVTTMDGLLSELVTVA